MGPQTLSKSGTNFGTDGAIFSKCFCICRTMLQKKMLEHFSAWMWNLWALLILHKHMSLDIWCNEHTCPSYTLLNQTAQHTLIWSFCRKISTKQVLLCQCPGKGSFILFMVKYFLCQYVAALGKVRAFSLRIWSCFSADGRQFCKISHYFVFKCPKTIACILHPMIRICHWCCNPSSIIFPRSYQNWRCL
jgi:hypothetical protein